METSNALKSESQRRKSKPENMKQFNEKPGQFGCHDVHSNDNT